jgi:hypothetical protein
MLWLSAGLVGLVALVSYFPAIKESHHGATKEAPTKLATPKNSKSGPAGRPSSPDRR